MASQKPTLPKRFQPLLQQAATETDLQYGPQEASLQSILNDTAHQYQQNLAANDTAAREMKGLLGAAPGQITQAYNDAGLTPSLLAQIGNSPTGQRIASELAANQAAIVQQQTGAQAGADYQRQHLGDQFRQDVGKIQDQSTALAKARGEYASSLLDQLISSDRSARHDANQQIRQQAFTASQNAARDANSTANALIGQGLQPKINSDGSVSIGGYLPGGKADPNAPGNKPKRTTGPGTASKDSQSKLGTTFQNALGVASHLAAGEGGQPGLVDTISGILTTGHPASQGSQPSTKQVRVLNADGTQKTDSQGKPIYKTVTTPGKASSPAQPAYDQTVAQAAAEQAVQGYVSTKTVRALQKLGYSVNAIPGLVTQTQYHQTQRRDPYTLNRPGTAPSRAQQPG